MTPAWHDNQSPKRKRGPSQSPERKRRAFHNPDTPRVGPVAYAPGSDRWPASLGVCLGVLVLLSGCRQNVPTGPDSVSDIAKRGPFSFAVEVRPTSVLVGDPITVELRVETSDQHVVQFPGEEDFGDLGVRQVDAGDPEPGLDGGLVWQQTITVDSIASGAVEIPSLVVKYAPTPADDDAEPAFEHALTTKPLQIEVRSALTNQDGVLSPRDITGTLMPPRAPLSPLAWTLIIGGAAGASILLVLMVAWLRRLARRPAPPILPEVWALRALAKLETADLIAGGRAREFYYRLSEIVRVYIERKFGLAAPEMTTEEFLGALARNRGALPYDGDRLRQFLQVCDLVKYAALAPLDEDAQQALRTARAFVDATAAARRDGEGFATADSRPKQGGFAA